MWTPPDTSELEELREIIKKKKRRLQGIISELRSHEDINGKTQKILKEAKAVEDTLHDLECKRDKLARKLKDELQGSLKENRESIVNFFCNVPDPLDLKMDYSITDCYIDYPGGRVLLIVQIDDFRKITCNLPEDEPAELDKVISAFRSHEVMEKLEERERQRDQQAIKEVANLWR